MKRTLLLAWLLVLGCGKPAPSTAPAARTAHELHIDPALVTAGRVRIAHVERRSARAELRIPAEVIASATGAGEAGALVAGRVVAVNVLEGDRVKRGQVLALIESPEIGRAIAELLRARARQLVSARKLERQRALERDHATSGNAVDEAQAEASIARADLAAARTLVRGVGAEEPAEVDQGADPSRAVLLARAPIRAPLDGVIARREAVLGGAVSPDRALFKIITDGTPAIVARVPEALAGHLTTQEGAEVQIVVRAADGQSASCAGKVRGSLGAVDPTTRALPIRVEPGASCTLLRPGAFVEVVVLDVGRGDALIVPRSALVDARGLHGVFVALPEPGRFSFRPVTVELGGGPDAVVREGLQEGEPIVSEGAILLKGELLKSEMEGT